MTVLSLYHWDFNRLGDDFDVRFEACSIAIFQWCPKSGGKGLKKVNACRVCGYTADVAGVYAKAQDLCDRLNAQQADVVSRPTWLQKQYSVARPGSVPPRVPRGGRVPPGAVRAIRERVMKRTLLPEGFVRGPNATWLRHRGDQIHVIYFQGSQYGDQYFVNLGFHYDFLPPAFGRKKVALSKYRDVNCALRARLKGNFDYGTDRNLLEQQLAKNAEDCLREFAKAEVEFARPRERFLNKAGGGRPPRGIWAIDDKEFYRQLAERH